MQDSWWAILNTGVVTLATAALAFVGIVEIRVAAAERATRRRAADENIFATGFLARRQMKSWLGPGAGSVDDFESWIRQAENARALGAHLDAAEKRFVEMLSRAGDATPTIAAATRTAAAHFFNGAGRLNEYVFTPRPSGLDIADWVNLRNMAWEDFRDSIRTIDDCVGVESVLGEAKVLDAKRRAAHPTMDKLFEQLADGLAKLDEPGSGTK